MIVYDISIVNARPEGVWFQLESPKVNDPVSGPLIVSGWVFCKHIPPAETRLRVYSGSQQLETHLNARRPAIARRLSERSELSGLLTPADKLGFRLKLCSCSSISLRLAAGSREIKLADVFLVQSTRPNYAIIGHSAAGKSTLLMHMGLDRWLHDADVYLSRTRRPPSTQNIVRWLSYDRDPALIVLPNHLHILNELASGKSLLPGTRFIYMKRSTGEILENIRKINADGLRHKGTFDEVIRNNYLKYDAVYRKLCDIEVDCENKETPEIATKIMGILKGEA